MGKKIIIIPIVFLIAVLGIRTYNKIEEYKIQKEISSKIIRFHNSFSYSCSIIFFAIETHSSTLLVKVIPNAFEKTS